MEKVVLVRIFCIAFIIKRTEGSTDSTEQRLIRELFSSYKRNARPMTDNQTEVITVLFGLEIAQLIDFDDRQQIMSTNVWVRQRWTNSLLTWNPEDYDDIRMIRVDPKQVWIPDIVLYNSADVVFSGGYEKYKTRVIINHTGYCSWYSPTIFRSTCNIDITYFPFDVQICHMKYGSWTFEAKDLDLQADNSAIITKDYVRNGEWDIVRSEKSRNAQYYACCELPFVDITITIVIQRKALFYIFNLITPCVIMLAMIMVGFFLPPESSERITLSITVLLAMAVFLQLISESLPHNSDNIPLLGVFCITIMTEIGLSLVFTCIILSVHHKHYKIPSWLDMLFRNYIGRCLRIIKDDYEHKESIFKDRNLFRGYQLCECVKHVKVPLNRSKTISMPSIVSHNDPRSYQCSGNAVLNAKSTCSKNESCTLKEEQVKTGRNQLDSYLFQDNMTFLAKNAREQRAREENIRKWREVALVMDRLLFLVFIFLVFFSGYVIFKIF